MNTKFQAFLIVFMDFVLVQMTSFGGRLHQLKPIFMYNHANKTYINHTHLKNRGAACLTARTMRTSKSGL